MEQKYLAEKIVGKILSKEILRTYQEAEIKSGLLIVEGFQDHEVFFATMELSQFPVIKIRITDELKTPNGIARLNSAYFFSDQETLALNRSEARSDFRVVFVMSEQSDQSSVTSMLKKNDDNIIDLSLGKLKFDALIDSVWEVLAGPKCLTIFKVSARFYLEALLNQKAWDNPLLRPSVRFVANALSQIVNINVKSQIVIEESLARALPELGMFDDIHGAQMHLKRSLHASRIKENFYGSNLYRPDGSYYDKDTLLDLARRIVFRNPDSNDKEFDLEENKFWQEKCISFVDNHPAIDIEIFKEIPWAIISQIFTAKSKVKLKLGQEIRDFLVSSAPGREEEFDNLIIEIDLDKGSSVAAEKLIEQKSSDPNEDPLFDLLAGSPDRLQTRVRNLAGKKGRKVQNFLPWLIKEIDEVRQITSNKLKLVLRPVQKDLEAGQNDFTIRLFAFLFGGTLKQISKEAEKLLTFELDCDHSLLDFEKPSICDFNEESKEHWPDLEILFEFYDVDDDSTLLNPPQKVLWCPSGLEMLKAFFIICCDSKASDVLAWEDKVTIDHWAQNFSFGNINCSELSVLNYSDLVSLKDFAGDAGIKWAQARHRFLKEIAQNGLSVEACSEYFERWSSEDILGYANSNEFKLSGTPLKEFDNFMRFDTLYIPGEIAVLPTHPLKVRWIGDYLSEMKSYALKAMAHGGLVLVDENREFFHRRIHDLAPSQIPPYFVIKKEKSCETYLPTSEFGWGEIYKPIDVQAKQGHIDFDDLSIKAIADECHTFIKHHIYKIRGTDILIVLDRPSKFPEKFLKSFYGSSVKAKSPRLRLHILAESDVLSQLDILKKQEGTLFEHIEDYQMTPFIDITAHKWEDKTKLPKSIPFDSVDITIVPELFGSSIKHQSKNYTQNKSDEKAFNSIHSRPVMASNSAAGGNASIMMLPESKDHVLYLWSNLSIRLKEDGSLTTSMIGTDYLSLVIELFNSTELLEKLHKASLWVVTLDKYLTRSNIENLSCRPEIISFKPNVGSSGSHNLIISAEMGKKFIRPRLVNKIGFLNQKYFSSNLTNNEINRIAEELFLESKGLAPSVVLRSLGGGWTINELMGLVCSKRYIDNNIDDYVLKVWIPLDHNLHWFGGGNFRKRADLLLLCGKYINGDLIIEFTVVESKFGKKKLAEDGCKQALESHKVLSSAFVRDNSAIDESVKADSRFWNQSLVDAIQSSGVCEGSEFHDGILNTKVKDYILTNKYKVSFNTPIVLCHSPEELDESINEVKNGVLCTYIGANLILKLLSKTAQDKFFSHESTKLSLAPDGGSEKYENTSSVSSPDKVDNKKSSKQLSVEGPIDEPPLSSENEGIIPIKFSSLSEDIKNDMYQNIISFLNKTVDPTIRPASDISSGIVEGPSCIRFKIENELVPEIRKINSKLEDLNSLMNLPQELKCGVFRDRGIWLEVPKEARDPILGSELLHMFSGRKYEKSTDFVVPVGLDSFGEIVEFDFSSTLTPHILVAGQTGGGKSVVIMTFIRGCIACYDKNQVQLAIIDPKEEFRDIAKNPHFGDRYYYQKNDWLSIIQHAMHEIETRKALFRETVGKIDIKAYNKRFPNNTIPRFLLIIDEFQEVVLENGRTVEDALATIIRIGKLGRALGVHLLISTQRPSKEVLDGSLKANIPGILCLKVSNGLNSRIILDENGAENLSGKGDAIFKDGGNKMTRMQVAIFEEDIV